MTPIFALGLIWVAIAVGLISYFVYFTINDRYN